MPEMNASLATRDGIKVIDALWRSIGKGVEIDGRAYHLDPRSWATWPGRTPYTSPASCSSGSRPTVCGPILQVSSRSCAPSWRCRPRLGLGRRRPPACRTPTMIVRRIRPETGRFLLTITGRRAGDRGRTLRSEGRDLDERQLVQLGLGHRGQCAEHDLLARREALVDDPHQPVGDRSGLAHGQVVDPGG